MGDSLESYPRRVFINVGLQEKDGRSSSTAWFARNYPTRNLDFEMYKIETVAEAEEPGSTKEAAAAAAAADQVGMSDWLKKNVKEEEYVVMKAEAEVVEEMVKSKALGLVDELFLECKPKGVERMSRSSAACRTRPRPPPAAAVSAVLLENRSRRRLHPRAFNLAAVLRVRDRWGWCSQLNLCNLCPEQALCPLRECARSRVESGPGDLEAHSRVL